MDLIYCGKCNNRIAKIVDDRGRSGWEWFVKDEAQGERCCLKFVNEFDKKGGD